MDNPILWIIGIIILIIFLLVIVASGRGSCCRTISNDVTEIFHKPVTDKTTTQEATNECSENTKAVASSSTKSTTKSACKDTMASSSTCEDSTMESKSVDLTSIHPYDTSEVRKYIPDLEVISTNASSC